MDYLDIIMGICAIVAAASIYFNIPNSRSSQSHSGTHFAGRPNNNVNVRRSTQIERVRDRRPDFCAVCLEPMNPVNMHRLNCGHALCQHPCFVEYRETSRVCPYCDQIVMRLNEPFDGCFICNEPMEPDNMLYLPCEHALHLTCLQLHRRNNNTCPLCP